MPSLSLEVISPLTFRLAMYCVLALFNSTVSNWCSLSGHSAMIFVLLVAIYGRTEG